MGSPCQHPPGIIRDFGRDKIDFSFNGVSYGNDGHWAPVVLQGRAPEGRSAASYGVTPHTTILQHPSYLGHVGEPLQDGVDPREVIRDGDMGDAIVVHDLHPSQLVVGGVNFTAQHLVRINTNTDQSLLTQELLLLALSQTPAQARSL